MRIEYPGAIYHVMSRGDRREDIFHDEVDRQDFLKTLAEACQKADFQVHAYCLMRNHFHLVVETPNGNLVAGMRWLLSSYTLRLNHRRKLCGHVLSGRYKALVVDGQSSGYLKTVCDYVHLNPVRAGLLGVEERLLSYPWSSFAWYLAAPAHRPAWMRVDRLLGEHGLAGDTAEARQEFERRMETRRAQETDGAEWEPLRRGWCLGGADFRKEPLDRIAGKLGEHHAGELRRETAAAKAERIIGEELQRLGWTPGDLERRSRSAPGKLELAARLRRETTLTIREIAQRLHLGSWKSATTRLQNLKRKEKQDGTRTLL
jgi:REP element-mobilizing transposase RayT